MQEVSAAWEATQRQLLVPESYLEMSYRISDPEAEADASAADNGHWEGSDTAQIINAAEKEYDKYAVLEQNSWMLDGSADVLPEDITQNMGYISDVFSNDNAFFDAPPVVSILFTQVHEGVIPGISIQWSTAFTEWANKFTVTAYNGDTVVASQTVDGNTDIITDVFIDISNYNRIDIEIQEWSLPYHRARIENIVIGIVKVFDKSDIVSFEHNQFVDLLSVKLPKAKINFTLENLDQAWNPDNPQGVYKYLIERQELTVRYGYNINGAIEWIKAGSFYVNDWQTPQNGITATFFARDMLEFMSADFVPTAGTFTLMQLAEQALTQADLPLAADGGNRWNIDTSLSTISVTIPTNEDGAIDFAYTLAEVLQLCANAACCVMYQDRDGKLNIVPTTTTPSDYLIDEFVSYKNSEYSLTKELKSVNVNDGLGTATNSATGEVQIINNPLIQTAARAAAVAEWVAGWLKGRKTLSGEYRADPRLDVCDIAQNKNKYATNNVVITDVTYTYEGAFNGKYTGRVLTDDN